LCNQLLAECRIEKRVDHHVAERLRAAEPPCKFLNVAAHIGVQNGKHHPSLARHSAAARLK